MRLVLIRNLVLRVVRVSRTLAAKNLLAEADDAVPSVEEVTLQL